jgi:peptidoglycan/LPS O-acetylase OafA/YrhL
MNPYSTPRSYRPDIDGLRAIAVLGVVLYHAGLGVPGGYVGVDIFFVISGFLITGHIIKDLEKGTFSMLGFWERRVRRIFPALAVMVIACLFAGYFLLLPFGYLVLAQSAIAQAVFSSNIQFWRTTGYFNPSAEENPLLHTWSLSVEEQFYLFVPLILAGLFAWRGKKLLLPSMLLGIVLSLALSVYWLRVDPTGAFYLLPSRAWELGMGSLVAIAQPLRSHILRLLLGVAGLLGILATYWLYDSRTLFPGLAALPPVIGSASIIWSGMRSDDGSRQSYAHRVLGWGPLVWIGLLSYSLYLWHWPFFAFHRYLFGQNPARLLSLFYVFLAFLMSLLSLKFIETPFRTRKLCSTRAHIVSCGIAVTSLIVFFSGLIYLKHGFPQRIPESALNYDRVQGNQPFSANNKRNLSCGLQVQELGLEGAPPKTLLWGDSHAEVLLGVLDTVCKELGVGAIAATKGGNPPVFGWSGERETTSEHKCAVQSGEEVRKLISKNKCLDHVILVFRWSYYIPRNPPLRIARSPIDGFTEALVSTIKYLQKKGLKVTIMKEVTIFQSHVARAMALNEWLGTPLPSCSLTEYQEFQKPYEDLIIRINLEAPGVTFIDPSQYFLNKKKYFEYLDSDGRLLYRDEHHLSNRGALRLKQILNKTIISNR